MTTTIPSAVADAISALVPDELRAESAAIAEQLRALAPSLETLVERARLLATELDRLCNEGEVALVSTMNEEEADDVSDGWGLLWYHYSGTGDYRHALIELGDLIRSADYLTDSPLLAGGVEVSLSNIPADYDMPETVSIPAVSVLAELLLCYDRLYLLAGAITESLRDPHTDLDHAVRTRVILHDLRHLGERLDNEEVFEGEMYEIICRDYGAEIEAIEYRRANPLPPRLAAVVSEVSK